MRNIIDATASADITGVYVEMQAPCLRPCQKWLNISSRLERKTTEQESQSHHYAIAVATQVHEDRLSRTNGFLLHE